MAARREDLERLAEELSRLAPEEQDRVLRSLADRRAPHRHVGLTWPQVRQLEGLVNLGGNAVEDTDRLYDA
jgi:hypothetical protein